jgi:EAL domain-containing protein (putative c-di-GMP-specific phosphodiesterase class I)
MRVWEFEDNKAIPSDLVREQDFIMRVRRLNRLGAPHLIINLVLTAIEGLSRNLTALEAAHERLQKFAKVTHGLYAEMSNGDAFITWEENKETHVLPARLLSALLPDDKSAAESGKFLLIFHLPDGYTPVRERINYYVEMARTAAIIGSGEPAQALQSEDARGPLTAWSVDQIEKLLTEIDLRRYVRTQPIYEYQPDSSWKPIAEEYFVSFADLKRERFPRVELIQPENLFLELCRALDQRLLGELALHTDTIVGRPIHLNISVSSVMGPVFAQFSRAIVKSQRGQITFEIHRGDLLQDFGMTLNAMMMMHREGFKVAIDGVTPDMINFLNLAAFEADFIKVNVSQDRAQQLRDPVIRKGLQAIAKEKLIFFRCDNDQALSAGLELGCGRFQGWYIDDAVQQARGT